MIVSFHLSLCCECENNGNSDRENFPVFLSDTHTHMYSLVVGNFCYERTDVIFNSSVFEFYAMTLLSTDQRKS